MNRNEYVEWMDDLKRKSPALGQWVIDLPRDTLDDWFEHVFAEIELRWAKAVNLEILTGDHDLTGYRRDQICAVFIRRSQELSHRQRTVEQLDDNQHVPALKLLKTDSIMGPMYRNVMSAMSEYRREHDDATYTPSELISQWTHEAAERFDNEPEDESKMPRYKCLRCQDTGFAKCDSAPNTVGHCDCERGVKISKNRYRSGRQIGPAKREQGDPLDNPFQAALDNF